MGPNSMICIFIREKLDIETHNEKGRVETESEYIVLGQGTARIASKHQKVEEAGESLPTGFRGASPW